jgi:hypothetical protein
MTLTPRAIAGGAVAVGGEQLGLGVHRGVLARWRGLRGRRRGLRAQNPGREGDSAVGPKTTVFRAYSFPTNYFWGTAYSLQTNHFWGTAYSLPTNLFADSAQYAAAACMAAAWVGRALTPCPRGRASQLALASHPHHRLWRDVAVGSEVILPPPCTFVHVWETIN